MEIQDVGCASQHSFVLFKNTIMTFGNETAGQMGLSEGAGEESVKIPLPLTYFKVF